MNNDCCKNLGLLFLRISIAGIMLFSHGIPKIQNFEQYAQGFPDPIGLGIQLSLIMAIFTEVVLALFIIFGFLTRFSAMGLAFTMLVIIFGVHLNDPWSKIEFAVLFLIPFLTLIMTGAGRYSIDHCLYSKSNSALLEKLFRP